MAEWITDLRDLEATAKAWDDLALHAVEPNVFFERWALLPALQHLRSPGDAVGVLLVWADASRGLLAGLMPAELTRGYRRLPVVHWRNWRHVHCPLGTPLVRAGHEEGVMLAFMAWFSAQGNAGLISFENFGADGPLCHLMVEKLPRHGFILGPPERWERALLNSGLDGERYLHTHLRKKKLKELRRLRRRLADAGRLEVDEYRFGDVRDARPWINEFLQLERQGWKGASGTALHCRASERAFAIELMVGAAEAGQLMMLKFSLDGEPVAMKVSFAAPSQGAFAFKIAYDERFEACSPGVLLEIENIMTVLDRSSVGWMDSCAVPDHPMIDHLWAERRAMCNLRVGARGLLNQMLLRSVWRAASLYRHYRKRKRVAHEPA